MGDFDFSNLFQGCSNETPETTDEKPTEYGTFSGGGEIFRPEPEPEPQYGTFSGGVEIFRPEPEPEPQYGTFSGGVEIFRPEPAPLEYNAAAEIQRPRPGGSGSITFTDDAVIQTGLDHSLGGGKGGVTFTSTREQAKIAVDSLHIIEPKTFPWTPQSQPTNECAAGSGVLRPDGTWLCDVNDSTMVFESESLLIPKGESWFGPDCRKSHTGEGSLAIIGFPEVSIDDAVCDYDKFVIIRDTLATLERMTDFSLDDPDVMDALALLQEASPIQLLDWAKAYISLGSGQYDLFVLNMIDSIPVFGKVLRKLVHGRPLFKKLADTVIPGDFEESFLNWIDDALSVASGGTAAVPPIAILFSLARVCLFFGRRKWDRAAETLLTLGVSGLITSSDKYKKLNDKIKQWITNNPQIRAALGGALGSFKRS